MRNRRFVVASLVGALAGTFAPRALASARPVDDDTPKATVVPGKPPILDFGDGLKIPLSKAAFLTLWEGKTFWLTYGAGRSSYAQRGNGEAVLFASGAMKLLLLTLAFEPDKLEHVDGCGWRLKEQDAKNYVRGDIDLPGKPFWPVDDSHLGYGSTDSPFLSTPASMGGAALDITGGFSQVDSFTAYLVKKKDVDLAYVRTHAQLL